MHTLLMGTLLAALPCAVVADGVFTPTTGSMTASRYYHTATLLVDGRVPVAGTFLGVGGMTTFRYYHTARQVSGRAFMRNLTPDEEAELVDRIVAIQAVVGCQDDAATSSRTRASSD